MRAVDDALASRMPGVLRYVAPDRMRVHDVGKVTLKMAPAELAKVVATEIEKLQSARGGQVGEADIKLGGVMRAELSGPDFAIDPKGPVDQPVSETETTTWEWTIQALEGTDLFPNIRAKRELTITISNVLSLGGKDRPRMSVDPWQHAVTIDVDLGTYTHRLVQAGNDAKWIWLTFLGIVGVVGAYFRKRKSRDQRQRT
jgi:hypothetical protein